MPQLNSEDAKAENKAMLGISPKPQPKAELTTNYADATDKGNPRNPYCYAWKCSQLAQIRCANTESCEDRIMGRKTVELAAVA